MHDFTTIMSITETAIAVINSLAIACLYNEIRYRVNQRAIKLKSNLNQTPIK